MMNINKCNTGNFAYFGLGGLGRDLVTELNKRKGLSVQRERLENFEKAADVNGAKSIGG